MSDEFQPEFADEFVGGTADVTDAESTSAVLRRVEQERDALLSANSFLDGVAATALDERDIARADLANTRAAFHLAEELRLKVTAELVSARTELDAVRAARDTLDREATRLRNQLLQLLQVPGEPTGGVLDSWVRYLCETCSARYSINFPDHEHGPLTPVLVTMTRRTEENETA